MKKVMYFLASVLMCNVYAQKYSSNQAFVFLHDTSFQENDRNAPVSFGQATKKYVSVDAGATNVEEKTNDAKTSDSTNKSYGVAAAYSAQELGLHLSAQYEKEDQKTDFEDTTVDDKKGQTNDTQVMASFGKNDVAHNFGISYRREQDRNVTENTAELKRAFEAAYGLKVSENVLIGAGMVNTSVSDNTDALYDYSTQDFYLGSALKVNESSGAEFVLSYHPRISKINSNGDQNGSGETWTASTSGITHINNQLELSVGLLYSKAKLLASGDSIDSYSMTPKVEYRLDQFFFYLLTVYSKAALSVGTSDVVAKNFAYFPGAGYRWQNFEVSLSYANLDGKKDITTVDLTENDEELIDGWNLKLKYDF